MSSCCSPWSCCRRASAQVVPAPQLDAPVKLGELAFGQPALWEGRTVVVLKALEGGRVQVQCTGRGETRISTLRADLTVFPLAARPKRMPPDHKGGEVAADALKVRIAWQ